MEMSNKTALVTGANSGLGFEAAAQLAEAGWGRVILACRSIEKAEAAKSKLTERTGKDPFEVVAIDTSEAESAKQACADLAQRDVSIDFLLLNAGASGKEPKYNSGGVEVTYASTLVGHHVLTLEAVANGLLSTHARIVIAGSEAARGNMPGMRVHDVGEIAKDSYSGDVVAAVQALMSLDTPAQKKFVNMNEYVTAKLLVAWWAAALARRLPAGTTVNAVSPGAALETSFGRDANVMMKLIMMPVMKLMGPAMGMAGTTKDAARRYLDAAEFGDDQNGQFYATAHKKKLVGPMGVQTWPAYFTDEASQEATFDAMVKVTGVGMANG